MREFRIRLRSVRDVQDFVGLATTMAFTISVEDSHHRVNGKSFMEMFCLNLSNPLTVSTECGDAEFDVFLAAAQRFLVNE